MMVVTVNSKHQTHDRRSLAAAVVVDLVVAKDEREGVECGAALGEWAGGLSLPRLFSGVGIFRKRRPGDE
jgi:hypothetical protein